MISSSNLMMSSAKSEPRVPGVQGPEDARRSGDDDSLAPVELSPFSALFRSAQAFATSTRQGRVHGGTPALMFEADVADPHERRLSSGQSPDRSALDAKTNNPMDRTGVEARRRAARDLSNSSRTQPTAHTSNGNRELLALVDGVRERKTARDYAPVQALKADSNGDSLGHTGARGAQSSRQADLFARVDQSSLRTDPSLANGAASAGVKPVAVIKAVGVGGGSPAEQIGRIVGSPKVSSVSQSPVTEVGASNGARSPGGQSALARPNSSEHSSPAKPDVGRAGDGFGRSQEVSRGAFDDLVRSLQLQSGVRRSSARMWLHPPELGRLYVEVRIEKDTLHIRFRTDNERARGLVSDRAALLKDALAEQGLRVEKLEVIYDQESEVSSKVGDRSASDDGGPNPALDDADARRRDAAGGRTNEYKMPYDGMNVRESLIDANREPVVTESRLDILV